MEDEPRVADYEEKVLTGRGYVVIAKVPTGEEAIKMAKEKRPDVILMDIMLAGDLDGIQTSEAIQSEVTVPIIYLTSHGESLTMDRAALTRPYSYLYKPVMEKDLSFAIEMAIYRCKMEGLLRESEERYRAVVDSQKELVCRMSIDGTLRFANNAYCSFFKVSRQNYGGSIFFDLFGAEDRLTLLSSLASEDFGQNGVFHESPIPVEDETKWLEWNIHAIHNDQKQIVEFQAVGRNITDRKKAEEALARLNDELEKRVQARTSELRALNKKLGREIEERTASEVRFRAIFEASPDCIFIKDEKGEFTHVNPSMESIVNRPASDLIGMQEGQVFGQERQDKFVEMDRRALQGDLVEFEHTRSIDGIPYTFNEARIPLRDQSHKVTGICGIARNVTDWTRPRTEFKQLGKPTYKSKAMRDTTNRALLAARKDCTVVLTGESGSGKDYLARFIHDQSGSKEGPFFTINCASLPLDLAESELFGHESGAFTGAQRRKRGLLELAEGGTLLLNEVGELSLQVQAKLLTFLDSRSFTRVGGEKQVQVSARLIAATNRDLETEVSRGAFRADLLFRLKVFSIDVPPLRQRKDDIPVLSQEILEEFALKHKVSVVPEIDAKGMKRMLRYRWPGNVRELRNVLERALILFEGGPFTIPELEPQPEVQQNHDTVKSAFQASDDLTLQEATHEFKAFLIKRALGRCGGNRTKAAKLLGISRVALRKYL
ncbi:sigma 54-interacting transcriptional regulator [Thermodesulfobacteriota bacterium]